MAEILWRDDLDEQTAPVTLLNPFPVQIPALQLNRVAGLEVVSSALRDPGRTHRSAVTAIDALAVPGTPTVAAGAAATGNLANIAYNIAISSGNQWGPTGASATSALTPSASQAIRVTFPTTAGITYNDIFLSTAAAPLWVVRVTSAQFATAGLVCTTVGTITTGGAAAAGQIDIGVVGTGVASNANPFVANNAYTPTSVTPVINCAGFAKAHLHVKVVVTDLRSLPTLTLTPFFQDQVSTADWFAGTQQAVTLLTAAGQSLEQDLTLTIDGATAMVVLVQAITGQGTAATVWVELA